MSPERRAAETAKQGFKTKPGDLTFLTEMLKKDMDRWRTIHLGYTIEEERLWLLFNRCCHPGRKIRLLPRPMRMAAGVTNKVVFRRPIADEVAREIIRMAQ